MTGILGQSFELMLIGMGFVFSFLILLVFATSAMSRFVVRYLSEPAAPVPLPASGVVVPRRLDSDQVDVDARRTAAISAALHEHRKNKQGKH